MTNPGHHWKNNPYRSIVPALELGIANGFDSPEQAARTFNRKTDCYAYARMGSPPVSHFCEWLNDLEGGTKTIATTTGMAATNLLVMALTTAKKRKIVTSPFIYGGTYHLFDLLIKQHNWPIVFVKDAFDLSSWEKAIDRDTAFVFLETPSNPRLDVFDIAGIAEIAHRKKTWLIVDNTIATPILQKPLEMGADATLHSVTKALTRLSVGLGGAVVCGKKLSERFDDDLYDWFVHLGIAMHPLSAFFPMLNRHTLERDMLDFSYNAEQVRDFLSRSPKIKKVYHPHFLENPQYSLAKKQMPLGGSGVLAFETYSFESAVQFIKALKRIILAPHLGDVQSLIIHPASTTHSKLSRQALSRVGITPSLIRLSVGLGSTKPIIADLKQALNRI